MWPHVGSNLRVHAIPIKHIQKYNLRSSKLSILQHLYLFQSIHNSHSYGVNHWAPFTNMDKL